MNEIQRYLAEEIAIDCGDGHITRTEALRRLRIMGLSAAVALGLLSACGSDDDGASGAANAPDAVSDTQNDTSPSEGMEPGTPAPSTAGVPSTMGMPSASEGVPPVSPPSAMAPATPSSEASTPPADPSMSALPTEEITFEGPRGPLFGAWASAAEPRGAVLVIHENRGLNDHIRSVVGRFAAAGYSALALDLLSEEGGTAALGDVANATAALGMAAPERFVADMTAALDELALRVPGAKLGAIGFCFGGGMMWRLLATEDPRLAAVAPFYGALPMGSEFAGASTAVLAVYGENDARVNATRDAAAALLEQAGLVHEVVTYPGANHAFFNDTGANYNADAAAQAWAKVLEWFGQNVGG